MGVLIDSSVLIRHERGQLALERLVANRPDEEFFISVVTASELLHGVHRATEAGVRAQRSAFVEAVLTRFPMLPIDLPTARVHAQIGAELTSQGSPIGAHDLWIGASCLANGLSLATENVRDFARVPGLLVEDWSKLIGS